MPGTLFVVATPIGNLEDITARALRTLGDVALVAAEDTRRTRNLLTHFGIKTPTTSLHEHNEHAKLTVLVERLRAGESIALVSDAGTPVISDPGNRLIAAAIEAGLRVEPIPGVSAVTSIVMASGLDASSFAWVGFPPRGSNDLSEWIVGLSSRRGTVIFFEAPHRLLSTLRRVLALAGNVKVCVGREMTKIHEEFLRGRLSEILPMLESPRGEFTIAVEFGFSRKSVWRGGPSDRGRPRCKTGRTDRTTRTSRTHRDRGRRQEVRSHHERGLLNAECDQCFCRMTE